MASCGGGQKKNEEGERFQTYFFDSVLKLVDGWAGALEFIYISHSSKQDQLNPYHT